MYSTWAKEIRDTDFSVINNIDVKDFWIRLLDDIRTQKRQENYGELVFNNIFKENYDSRNSNGKRKIATQEASDSRNASRPRVEFREIDGLLVSSIDISLGSHIGNLARTTVVHDRQSHYFMTCGMNGIIDISDKSEGSQLCTIEDSIDEINQLFPKYSIPISTPSEFKCAQARQLRRYYGYRLDIFEAIIRGQVIRQNNSSKYFKKCLDKVKIVKTKDKLEIIKDLYQFVFKLHSFHKYFFNPNYKQLSEEDYMIKIWSSLIETMFRSLDDHLPIISHWGDTTSEQVKDDGKIIRMDLRLIACETPIEQNKIIDAAVAEFAPKVFKSKYYKDKLKTVLASKAQLNSLLGNNEDLDEQTLKDIAIPFMTIMGLECEIYTLRLVASGMYVVDVVYTMVFPSSAEMMRDGGMKSLIQGLYLIKSLCMNVIEAKNKKNMNIRKKNEKSQKGLRGYDDEAAPTKLGWLRDLWYPPQYESDS